MADFSEDHEPLNELDKAQLDEIFGTIGAWAARRPPGEPLLAFLDGTRATAGDVAAAFGVPPKRSKRSLFKFARETIDRTQRVQLQRVQRHLLNLVAVEVREAELSTVLEHFREPPPEQSVARVPVV